MVSTSQKISCLLARIRSFFEKCFTPNSINGFHQLKNSSDQKTLFPLDIKSVPTIWIKDLLKNAFPLRVKVLSTLKNLKISEHIKKADFHQQEYISSLKIDCSQVSIIVSILRKKLGIKQYGFQWTKIFFPLAEVKDWVKNMFQLKTELFPQAAVDCCLR